MFILALWRTLLQQHTNKKKRILAQKALFFNAVLFNLNVFDAGRNYIPLYQFVLHVTHTSTESIWEGPAHALKKGLQK